MGLCSLSASIFCRSDCSCTHHGLSQRKHWPLQLERIDLLRQMATEAGRDPDSISVTIYGCPIDAEVIDRYRAAGVDRVVFWLPAVEPERVLATVAAGAEHIN